MLNPINAECCYEEHHYGECRYAECRGASKKHTTLAVKVFDTKPKNINFTVVYNNI